LICPAVTDSSNANEDASKKELVNEDDISKKLESTTIHSEPPPLSGLILP
jgi:hypothetical protein